MFASDSELGGESQKVKKSKGLRNNGVKCKPSYRLLNFLTFKTFKTTLWRIK